MAKIVAMAHARCEAVAMAHARYRWPKHATDGRSTLPMAAARYRWPKHAAPLCCRFTEARPDPFYCTLPRPFLLHLTSRRREQQRM